MGRIKTQLVKRATMDLYKRDKDLFKKSFDENKAIVDSKLEIRSKKLRNSVTGYITRLMKTKED